MSDPSTSTTPTPGNTYYYLNGGGYVVYPFLQAQAAFVQAHGPVFTENGASGLGLSCLPYVGDNGNLAPCIQQGTYPNQSYYPAPSATKPDGTFVYNDGDTLSFGCWEWQTSLGSFPTRDPTNPAFYPFPDACDAYFAATYGFAVGSDQTGRVGNASGSYGTPPSGAPPTIITVSVPTGGPLPPDHSTYGPISYTWTSTFTFFGYIAFISSGSTTNDRYGLLLQGHTTINFRRQLLSITHYVYDKGPPTTPPPPGGSKGVPPPPVGGWWGHYTGHLGFGWGGAQKLYPPGGASTRTPQGLVHLPDGTPVPAKGYVPSSVSWNNGNAIEFVAGVVQTKPTATPGNTPPTLLLPGVARSLDHGDAYRLVPFAQKEAPFDYLRGSLDPYRNRILVIGWRGTWDAAAADYPLATNRANALVLRVYPQGPSGAYDDTRPETVIKLPQVDGNRQGSPCGNVWDIEAREDGGLGFLYLDINNYIYLVTTNTIPSDSTAVGVAPVTWLSQRVGPLMNDAAGNGPTAPVYNDARFAWGRGGSVLVAVIGMNAAKKATVSVLIGQRMTPGLPTLTWSPPAPALDATGKPLPLTDASAGQTLDIWARPGDGSVHLAIGDAHYLCTSLAADGTGAWTLAYPKPT